MSKEKPQATGATLVVEFDTDQVCPINFLGDSSDIVFFISFAYSERYGSDHDLARASSYLKRKLNIKLTPLLTFGDACVDDQEEASALESLWQEAEGLAHCCHRVSEAITETSHLKDLTKEFPELPERLAELAEMADWAAVKLARVRLTYAM